jgi:hypothetical protein
MANILGGVTVICFVAAGGANAADHVDLGRWLRDYSGALAALASFVLVAVTIVYVVLTRNLSLEGREQLREMKAARIESAKARLDARMPYMVITVEPLLIREGSEIRHRITLSNMSQFPADIEIYFPPDWRPEPKYDWTDWGAEAIYLTSRPNRDCLVHISAPVDLNGPVGVITQLEFLVSPQAKGVQDKFMWTGWFDASSDEPIDESESTALHQWRRYPELGDLAPSD